MRDRYIVTGIYKPCHWDNAVDLSKIRGGTGRMCSSEYDTQVERHSKTHTEELTSADDGMLTYIR